MGKSNEVVLDTNFILAPVKFPIDIEDIREIVPNAELITVQAVIDELQKLHGGKVGLDMIKRFEIKVKPGKGHADDVIFDYAKRNKAVVATNDKEFKDRLISENIPVVFIRSRSKIEIKGYVG